MCTAGIIEATTSFDRASRVKMCRNIVGSRIFCKIANRSVGFLFTHPSAVSDFLFSQNRPLAILKKSLNQTTFAYILKNFRMCTIAVEALTPLDRTSSIKMYKNIARSRLFCRIAKRPIATYQVYMIELTRLSPK